MNRYRYRIRFSKQNDLRMIGHRDLLRTVERLLRRAELDLSMTEGFHPKPRMSFPLALAVGIEGREEVMEIELAEELTAEEVLSRLRQHTVPGLGFDSVEKLPPGEKKAHVESVGLEFPVPPERTAAVARVVEAFLAETECLVERDGRAEPIDVRRDVAGLSLEGGRLRMTLRTARDASARPREVLAALGLADLELQGSYLTRTTVTLAKTAPKRRPAADNAKELTT